MKANFDIKLCNLSFPCRDITPSIILFERASLSSKFDSKMNCFISSFSRSKDQKSRCARARLEIVSAGGRHRGLEEPPLRLGTDLLAGVFSDAPAGQNRLYCFHLQVDSRLGLRGLTFIPSTTLGNRIGWSRSSLVRKASLFHGVINKNW